MRDIIFYYIIIIIIIISSIVIIIIIIIIIIVITISILIFFSYAGLRSRSSEQQWRLHFCTRYFHLILYTNVNTAKRFNPYFGLKSQILVDWNFANTDS